MLCTVYRILTVYVHNQIIMPCHTIPYCDILYHTIPDTRAANMHMATPRAYLPVSVKNTLLQKMVTLKR